MKFNRDPNYEAAFVRAANHDEPTPEELAFRKTQKARRLKVAVGAALLLVVAGAVIATNAVRRDSPSKQAARGLAYSAANSHVSALLEYKRSLQEEPDQPAVRVMLGKELSLMGNPKGAEIEFQKAIDAHFELNKTVPLLVESLLRQGRFDQVIAVVNSATIDSPEANAELLAMRGSSYFALGREAEAEQSWDAANDFVPGHAGTVIARSRALASKGEFDKAGALLDGISADASKIELLTLKGELARATRKLPDALLAYEAALKIEPDNMLLRTNYAHTLLEMKRFDEAGIEIKKVLKPTPRYAYAQFIAALIAVGKKDYSGARESAQKAVQLVPTDGRFQLLAGTLAMEAGNRSEAETYLNAAITLLPNSADARRLLALIYVDRHEARRADQLFRPVFERFAKDQDIAKIEARIALQQGDRLKAANAFDQIDPGDPKNIDATLLAASLKIEAGDKTGGIRRLEAAARGSPDNADVDAALVRSHLTFKEPSDAMVAWKSLAKKEPDSARTFNLLAAIELMRGDKVAARRSMERAASADPHYLSPVSGLAMLDIGEKKNADAKNRLRGFASANPLNADAALLWIQLARAEGAKSVTIVNELRDALKANPRSPQLALALAAQLDAQGETGPAIAVAEEGLRFSSADVPLMEFVGDRSLRMGNLARAIAVMGKLQELDASSANYPTGLGLALVKSGKFEEALSSFRLALSHNADNVDRQAAMVGSLIAAGRGEEAQRILYEISRAAPKSPVLTELDADVKLQLKQYPEAIASYRKALATKPNPRLAIKMANALLTARLRGEANVFLADWLKANPRDDEVRLYDADVAMRAKDHARAINDLRVLAAAHPADPSILNNLAWNLAQQKDPTAVAVAEKASALAPDNPAITDTLGWLLVENGDVARGLGLIEKASRGAPNELDIHLHLARAQLKQGQNAAARATLQSVITKAPESEQGKASQALLATF